MTIFTRLTKFLTEPSIWNLTAIVLLGGILLLLGSNVGARSNALFARTEYAVATVDTTAGQLLFTTWKGEAVRTPLITDCRRSVRSPRTGCQIFFVDGDEVLINYDPEEPTWVWSGITPGGGKATILIALGIILLVGGGLDFWWVVAKPWLRTRFHRSLGLPPH
jgi:hypothetical protein